MFFCVRIHTYCLRSFVFFSDRRTFFTIPCKASLITTHCLSFGLFGNAFISPLFFKVSFPGYRILGWQFFSLISLYMVPPSPGSKLQSLFLAICLFIYCFYNCLDYFSKFYLHPLFLPSSFPPSLLYLVLIRGCRLRYAQTHPEMTVVLAGFSSTVSFPHHTQLLSSTHCQLIALLFSTISWGITCSIDYPNQIQHIP